MYTSICFRYLSISLLISVSVFVFGQQGKRVDPAYSVHGDISLIGKWDANKVKLRWGYDHPELWYHQINKPLAVFRRNVTMKGQYEKIADILPLDSTAMELLAAETNDEMLVVTLENMYRHWDNTTFDGYSNILEKNDNFFNRWSLTHLAADRSFTAAKAAGLAFVDTPPDPTASYAYKVEAKGNKIISDYKVIFHKKPFVPVIFDLIEGEGHVIINWDKKLHDYHYTAYWIETSTDGKNFARTSDAPFIQMVDVSVTDQRKFYSYTLPSTNYKKTFIRLIGIDAFGDESQASTVESGMAKDKTPPSPPFVMADSMKTHLSKKFTLSHEHPQDVNVYHLERSFDNETTIIKNWLSPDKPEGMDSVSQEGMYKYRVIAVDSAGNEAFSPYVYTKIYDLLPPSQPSKPHALTDTTEVISIYWEPHPEKDVIGYNVYAADGLKRNFTKLNSHIHRQHFFLDTLNLSLMNEKRYYYIVAVDNDYMLSLPSEALEVLRPDKMPPSPAHIANYEVTDSSIRLTIFPSSSRDVASHQLWRKEGGQYSLIQALTTIPPYIEDKNIKSATAYTYKIIAIDHGGRQSKAVKEIHLSSKVAALATPMGELVEGDGGKLSLLLSQTMPKNGAVVVFRSVDGGPFSRWKVTESFPVNDVAVNKNALAYKLAFRADSGQLGPLSEQIVWTSKTK